MINLSRATAILLFFLAPLQIRAGSVVFDEIAWMGTTNSSNDEWIRIYNNSENNVILDNWKISIDNGAKQIILKGEIQEKGYYLLERTDDTTLPDISADLIYAGALKNDGEKLELYDNSNNLIDFLDCSLGWFAGDNETKQTMKRIDPDVEGNDSENWQSGEALKIEISEKENANILLNGTVKNYPGNILFNEILPSPEGPDQENEWIEIFNNNDFDADISGWKITDTMGAIKTYIFPKGTIIKAKGFLLSVRPENKITMNNDNDSLKLSHPDGTKADEVYYEKAPNGQSYNLTEKGWKWSFVLTPEALNIISNSAVSPENTKTVEEKIEQNVNLASVNEPLSKIISQEKSKHSFSPIIISIIISLLSAVMILFLKRSLLKK